jgi:hypothetical protein
MVDNCSPPAPQRNTLQYRIGQIDMRVHNIEIQLREEIQRSNDNIQEYRNTMRDLMQQIKDKNDIKEFLADNWKYICVLIAVLTGGDVTSLIQMFAQLGKAL